MRKSFLSAVTATSLAWAAAAFECSEDFSVADERGVWQSSLTLLSHVNLIDYRGLVSSTPLQIVSER